MTQDITKLTFNYNTTRYQPENAYWMSLFSNLVYLKKNDSTGDKEDFSPDSDLILEKLKALDSDFLSVESFNLNSSQSIIVQHQNYVVGVFRGTDELKDWLDNVRIFPTKGPFGNVHSGFYNALLDVWKRKKMWDRIKELQYRGAGEVKRSLWLTGHSLGGAMATLAAACLAKENIPLYGVYTFGQPRCGDDNFQVKFDSKLKEKFFRFQNRNDIVTRIPARAMGYEHVGRYIYITENRELKSDVSWWYRFVESIEGIVEDILDNDIRLNAIDDHRLEQEYIEGIKAWGNRLPDEW